MPATLRIYDATVRHCEINFLCIHKKLRAKRLAPVLIKEVGPPNSCAQWGSDVQATRCCVCLFSLVYPTLS